MAELRNAPDLRKALRQAAADPESKNFGHAWKYITEYDDDKPAEKKQIVGPVEVRVKVVREGRRVTAS